MGQDLKPPVIKVLSQLRFKPFVLEGSVIEQIKSSMSEFVVSCQELRPKNKIQIGEMVVEQTSGEVVHQFNTKSGFEFNFSPSFIAFSTKTHKSFNLFEREFSVFYRNFFSHVPSLTFVRLGLRYINLLSFKETAQWEEYVQPRFHHSRNSEGWTLSRRAVDELYNIGDGISLACRCRSGPQDPSLIFGSDIILEKAPNSSIAIDMDASIGEGIKSEKLGEHLSSLRKHISHIFWKKIMSEKANLKWNPYYGK